MVQEEKKNKFFDTLLKFKESEINGELVGFVYANKDGKLFGTREDDPELILSQTYYIRYHFLICLIIKDIL